MANIGSSRPATRSRKEKGTLKTTEQQKVETKVVETKQVIVIEQANPQVVYVPVWPKNSSAMGGAPTATMLIRYAELQLGTVAGVRDWPGQSALAPPM